MESSIYVWIKIFRPNPDPTVWKKADPDPQPCFEHFYIDINQFYQFHDNDPMYNNAGLFNYMVDQSNMRSLEVKLVIEPHKEIDTNCIISQ